MFGVQKVCLLLALAIFYLPAQAQTGDSNPPAAAGRGSAADLELTTFGEFVEPGRPLKKPPSGLHKFMTVVVLASYSISRQYSQALRICRFRELESTASDVDRTEARSCQIAMLVNLGRFAQAEQLAYEDGFFNTPNTPPSLDHVNRWRLIAAIASAQGSTAVAENALRRAIALAETVAKQSLPAPEPAQAAAAADMNSLQRDNLAEARSDSILRLARFAYFRQDADEYERLLRLIFQGGTKPVGNAWGVLALETTDSLQLAGKVDYAKELAEQSYRFVKADAGFRDASEPLQNFDVPTSISDALGDEKVQRGHVEGRLRLAKTYALLGRSEEATTLLEHTHALAARYVMEPGQSSTLIAAVEEVQGDQYLAKADRQSALAKFRMARSRFAGANELERSSSYGRRHIAFDNAILGVSAKILSVMAALSDQSVLGPAEAEEALSIAAEFSASRADSSVRQAARSTQETRPAVRSLLEREGLLIDEMIDLRGVVASRASDPSAAGVSETRKAQARLSAIFAELKAIKSQLKSEDGDPSEGPASNLGARLQARIGGGEAIWQWVLSPGNNVVVCVTKEGVRLKRIAASATTLSTLAKDLHVAGSLRQVRTEAELRPFPREKAIRLYDALFGDIAPGIGSKEHWIVIAPPVLDGIPWAALRAPMGDRAMGRSQWLVEKVALTSSPSLNAWAQLAERPRSQASMAFLGVGDPANEGGVNTADLRLRGAIVSAVAPVAKVEAKSDTAFASELRGVAKLFPEKSSTLLMGKQATKSALLKLSLQDYRVILFSTHGYLGGAMLQAMGPSLELTGRPGDPRDRFLAANEISALRLDSDLVFLSACDTSASDGQLDGEGFSGLASAFLLSGSRSVVVSLWPVETSATEALVRRALKEYQDDSGRPVAFAMRAAMLSLISSPRALWQHPGFWSPFVVAGR